MFVGLEYRRQFRCAVDELLVVGRQQGAGPIEAGGMVPVGAQFDQDPVPVHRDTRVRWGVEVDEFTGAQLVDEIVEEVDGPVDQGAFVPGCAVHTGGHDHVGRGAGEQCFRLLQRLSPPPALEHPGVAGLGQRSGAEVGSHQQGVRVLPGHSGLRLRQREAIGYECCRPHVEFADHRRVGTAAGQRDQRQRVVGVEDVGAGPHPVLVLRVRQGVDVDEDLPVGLIAAVAVQCGAPPQSARVVGVPPEVVEVFPAAANVGDAGVGVEHLQGLGTHPLEGLIAEPSDGGLVAFVHPVQRVAPVDVFQPQMGVLGHAAIVAPGGSVTCITCPDPKESADDRLRTSGCLRRADVLPWPL